MDPVAETYQVIVTRTAQERYFEVLYYVYQHYTEKRADQIAEELLETPEQLAKFPYRGTPEENLSHRPEGFRYILYDRAERATVKVIYFVDEKRKTVYVTDFFPTEMSAGKISRRS